MTKWNWAAFFALAALLFLTSTLDIPCSTFYGSKREAVTRRTLANHTWPHPPSDFGLRPLVFPLGESLEILLDQQFVLG